MLRTFKGRANIIPAYSQTFGFEKDLESVYNIKIDKNHTTDFIKKFTRQLKFDIAQMDAANDPRKIFITCFSRGAPDVFHVANNLSAEEKNRLFITACGPIMILPRDLGFRVINLVSRGDWCCFACNKSLFNHPKRYEKFADIQLLPQIDGFSGINRDHFFESKTYQEGIARFTVPEYEKLGVLR